MRISLKCFPKHPQDGEIYKLVSFIPRSKTYHYKYVDASQSWIKLT